MNVPSIARSLPGLKQVLNLIDKVNSLEKQLSELEAVVDENILKLTSQEEKIKHLKTLLEEEDRVIKAIAASLTKQQIQEIADRFGDRNLKKLVDTLVGDYGRQLTMKIREPIEDAARNRVDGWMRDWIRTEMSYPALAAQVYKLQALKPGED